MTEPEIYRPPFINQIALLAMSVLIVYLVVDFGRQVVLSRQRHDELRRVEQQIRAVMEEREELEQCLEWTQSSEAAEAFAREQGWAREGEVSVVLVEPALTPVPTPATSPVARRVEDSTREAWWGLFFGER